MVKRTVNQLKIVQDVLEVLDKCRAGTQTYADTTVATKKLHKLETVLKQEKL